MADTKPADPNDLLARAELHLAERRPWRACERCADYVLWRVLNETTPALEKRYERILERLIGWRPERRGFSVGTDAQRYAERRRQGLVGTKRGRPKKSA